MFFLGKDFISLKDITAEEILYILDTAETMKQVLSQKNKKTPYLQGKSIILLFYEDSSRAKLSYQLAAQYLSANIIDMTIPQYIDNIGGLVNMGKMIEQMGADFIVIRHPMSGSSEFLADNISASIINAGDGLNENPSQALLDLMTIKNEKGSFKGLKVAIVGDIAHSRSSRSNILGLIKLGAEVCIAAPPTLVPPKIEDFGVKVYYNVYEAVKDADVIMVLRLDKEEAYGSLLPSYNEYTQFFKIDSVVLKNAKPNAIVMHPPGTIKRGIEISSEILASPSCFFNDQISNGIAVRMALLYLLSIKGGN